MPIVSKATFLAAKFDYVIIGGGTAASVKLSEDPKVTVGVIEAGVDYAGDPAVTIPGMMALNTRNPRYDWEFYTEPQVHVQNRKIQSSRGKGLGGSSMQNFLAFGENLCPINLSADVAKDFAVVPDPSSHGMNVDPKTATRSYSASAYLAPNVERNNLLVLTEAFVLKVRFEKQENNLHRAEAVDLVVDDEQLSVEANKEIILCAGTFQAPQLLEVSGIGNRDLLSNLSIECLIDLPGVGENLQDHMLSPIVVQIDQNMLTVESLRDPEQLKLQQELYDTANVKRWAASATIEASSPEAFVKTPPSALNGIKKQYEIMRTWIDSIHPLGQLLNLNGLFPVLGFIPDPSKRYMTMLAAYIHPLSRGTVHITSKDAQVPPAIQPNYLANPADLDILCKTVKFAYKRSDCEQVTRYVQETMLTVHHPVGAASMMPREDGGVIDPSLLVYGTSNLRVVDCSIIPLEISCNIQTLAYAIGEKAADIIKQTA
ncbi:GMC oxidoreductase [Sphaerobolus stellatus SS14]|uniref:GMC oxidoreductase n=1 Tax=Sphaerobolus stellatus (strain SS14) TaxID=990650 RepID=A0A0C9VQ72_SPHS4|nr:GMC oxidoreductase [Sphaerobolus stellatus SS14]